MARMLGSSRTLSWALCRCIQCRRQERSRRTMHNHYKRTARYREDRFWRDETTRMSA